MRVRNWEKWQSYRKDRHLPPWIKLHRCVLRNQEWVKLTDAQRGHLVSMWMLAADKNGELPDDPRTIQKMCFLDCEPDINLFIELGFLDATVTPERRHVVSLEKRRGQEKSRTEKKERSQGSRIPPDWRPSVADYEWANAQGYQHQWLQRQTEMMRNWAEANAHREVARKLDWSKTWRNWMLREGAKQIKHSLSFKDAVQAHIEEVDSRHGAAVSNNGLDRRAICGSGSISDPVELHAEATGLSGDAKAADDYLGWLAKGHSEGDGEP